MGPCYVRIPLHASEIDALIRLGYLRRREGMRYVRIPLDASEIDDVDEG